ncbi:hypothetical protein GYMLUDRAFT_94787 [Collybiopsis luxurians FD-317 M1]|nr:hypothetical protein GYMLUDRAFT_94787 [Collybiopsis luxurians FD-317 M1]
MATSMLVSGVMGGAFGGTLGVIPFGIESAWKATAGSRVQSAISGMKGGGVISTAFFAACAGALPMGRLAFDRFRKGRTWEGVRAGSVLVGMAFVYPNQWVPQRHFLSILASGFLISSAYTVTTRNILFPLLAGTQFQMTSSGSTKMVMEIGKMS